MSIELHARLDTTRRGIKCGRLGCGRRLLRLVPDREAGREVKRAQFRQGWACDEPGRWTARERNGETAFRRPVLGMERQDGPCIDTATSIVRCPDCNRDNIVSAEKLGFVPLDRLPSLRTPDPQVVFRDDRGGLRRHVQDRDEVNLQGKR